MAAPLSGAKPLAKSLVDSGWHTGGLAMPDLRDPSVSSYENDMLVSANQIVLNGSKYYLGWNDADALNWVSFFERTDISDVPTEWADHFSLQLCPGKCVLKDPQLMWTFGKWQQLATSGMNEAVKIVLFRFPVDFVASMLHGCDAGWWPDIPKDINYLTNLWSTLYENVMRFDDGTFIYVHASDQLVDPVHIGRINTALGSEVKPFDVRKVMHRVRRDTAEVSQRVAKIYDKLMFLTMRTK